MDRERKNRGGRWGIPFIFSSHPSLISTRTRGIGSSHASNRLLFHRLLENMTKHFCFLSHLNVSSFPAHQTFVKRFLFSFWLLDHSRGRWMVLMSIVFKNPKSLYSIDWMFPPLISICGRFFYSFAISNQQVLQTDRPNRPRSTGSLLSLSLSFFSLAMHLSSFTLLLSSLSWLWLSWWLIRTVLAQVQPLTTRLIIPL